MIKLLLVFCSILLSVPVHADTIEINGVDLEYEIKGSGQHTVLFDAGALSGMSGWDSIWGKLPDEITAIRYSRRGEGNSGPCSGNLSATDYAADAEALLESLGINKPITYVSHSYGSQVAREYASRNPGTLAAMLFVDPANPKDVVIVEKVDPENGPAEIETIRENDFKTSAGKFCFLEDIWAKAPLPGLREIGDVPMTLIAGVKHHDNPSMIFHTDKAVELWGQVQAEWVNQFPRGKAVMAKKSGHFTQDDQPELVIAELKALLERADGSK